MTGPEPVTSSAARTSLRHVPAQQRSVVLVEKVLESATQIANERGLASITTSAVAKRARISVAAVYRYFPDRLAILHALMARDVDIFVAQVHELFRTTSLTSMTDLVRLAVGARVAMYRDKTNVGSLLLVEMVGGSDAALNRSRLVADVLVDTLYDVFEIPSNQNQVKRVELGVRLGDVLIHRAFKLDPAGEEFVISETEQILASFFSLIYSDA